MSTSQSPKLFQGFETHVLATGMLQAIEDLKNRKKGPNFFELLDGAEAFFRKARAYRTQQTLSEPTKYPHLDCMAAYQDLLPGIRSAMAKGETEENCIVRLTETLTGLRSVPIPSEAELTTLFKVFAAVARTTLFGNE